MKYSVGVAVATVQFVLFWSSPWKETWVIAALLIYRVLFNIIPLVIATVLLATREVTQGRANVQRLLEKRRERKDKQLL